ncbi:MAG: type I-E CRISPR-associated protein Cas7/Cse4/CasC [Deltaproteobacteria bacterium]|nr:type I-E CRISPR-associated protein Cas7/Cse4/CasC [Deltaproteobacteria bacterium]
MFIQIHMLQSMPPGNLNRDDIGQPKKCIFGGVTRSRISSQCQKRNIRLSTEFKDAFGDARTVRTTYLPRMVADELKEKRNGISEDDLKKIKDALAGKFKTEKGEAKKGEAEKGEAEKGEAEKGEAKKGEAEKDQTGQLVFFPPPFAKEIANLILDLRDNKKDVFEAWVNGTKKEKVTHKEDKKHKKAIEDAIEEFEKAMSEKSESLTVDIGMFGRMTTSDLVVNVEAACQVAHAISTHEAIIESDYFTAMDDKNSEFAPTQTKKKAAGFMGAGETVTFFNSAVYYKYLNLDLDALKEHLSWKDNAAVENAASVLVRAAALANPTGKQNSFAAHGIPELILVEVSKTKRPISYANAFLKPVDDVNLMTGSAKALSAYINTVAKAFAPADMRRVLMALGSASVDAKIEEAKTVDTLDALVGSVVQLLKEVAHEQRP